MHDHPAQPVLIVTADDYGYAPGYNRGILVAVGAGALDAVSAMVGRRWCEPAPLLAAGVEIGLHLELPGDPPPAQTERFESLFGHAPAFLDGHHHCHASDEHAGAVARFAAEQGLPVRSVDDAHRRLLREAGVATQDRLVGRRDPSEPALPPLLAGDDPLPAGVTEWFVHPGYRDPRAGSAYDEPREQDLEMLLTVGHELARRAVRRTHGEALAGR
jgi:predicted glycoside hydrolase/deacetylase ChbG (UPF0249 family)